MNGGLPRGPCQDLLAFWGDFSDPTPASGPISTSMPTPDDHQFEEEHGTRRQQGDSSGPAFADRRHVRSLSRHQTVQCVQRAPFFWQVVMAVVVLRLHAAQPVTLQLRTNLQTHPQRR